MSGWCDDERWERFRARVGGSSAILSGSMARWCERNRATRVPASQRLRQPEVRLAQLLNNGELSLEIDADCADVDIASAETTVKYAGYIRRQESEIERGRRDERRRIPHDFPFSRVPGLSREVVQRLVQVRPDTLGHALRIPGVTPAAVAVLSAYVGRLVGAQEA